MESDWRMACRDAQTGVRAVVAMLVASIRSSKTRLQGVTPAVRSCADEKAFEGLAALRFCHRRSHHIIEPSGANLLGCGVREGQFARTTWERGGCTRASSSRTGKLPIVSHRVVFLALYVIIGQLGVSMQRTKCKADTCTMLIRASRPFLNRFSFRDCEGGIGMSPSEIALFFSSACSPACLVFHFCLASAVRKQWVLRAGSGNPPLLPGTSESMIGLWAVARQGDGHG